MIMKRLSQRSAKEGNRMYFVTGLAAFAAGIFCLFSKKKLTRLRFLGGLLILLGAVIFWFGEYGTVLLPY